MTDQIQIPLPIGDDIDAVMASMKERKRIYRDTGNSLLGLTTGLDELDRLTLGCQCGDLIFIAGRPGMGKTTLAMNMADAQAANGACTLFVSVEMKRKTLLLKLFAIKSGVPMRDLQIGRAYDHQYADVEDIAEDIRRLPLYVGDDIRRLAVIGGVARKMKESIDHGLDAIYIDYLQLVEAERGGYSRENDVATMSRMLKGVAGDLNVPVICLCQLNRRLEERDPPRPRLSDLRESGAIEQDADVVLMLYRGVFRIEKMIADGRRSEIEEALDKQGMTIEQGKAQCEIIVAKQRNGPTGTVPTWFDENTQRFRNWDEFKQHSPAIGG